MSLLIGYLLAVPGVFITIGMHEYIKAMASTALGDTVPKREGRCTLNLLKHIDPLGFIIMLLFGLGWGKPVNTSSMFYKNRKKDTLIVYVLPSVANMLIAFIMLGISVIMSGITVQNELADTILFYTIIIFRYCAQLSISFAIFNIIPVYPLDGAKVLSMFLSPQASIKMTQYEKIFQMILVFLIVLGIINQVIDPVVKVFMNIGF